MKVLELYSGIGGMHLALKESRVKGEIICSVDINTTANKVYRQNFPKTLLQNQNVETLTPEFISKLNVDTILMSPPCQPFTRNGLKGDTGDSRTSSFLHVLQMLPELTVQNILIENVKGFETSNMRNILAKTLKEAGYIFQEFILSPSQFGIPNTRHRYYCLAKRLPERFNFENSCDSLMTEVPGIPAISPFPLSKIIDEDSAASKHRIPDETLRKEFRVMDICGRDSTRSCCFTRSYSRYFKGTGSIYSDRMENEVEKIVNNIDKCNLLSDEGLREIKKLNLRNFTPREVCRLMCFPEAFKFPPDVTSRQRYMLLGNSINVTVVSELIKVLVNR